MTKVQKQESGGHFHPSIPGDKKKKDSVNCMKLQKNGGFRGQNVPFSVKNKYKTKRTRNNLNP